MELYETSGPSPERHRGPNLLLLTFVVPLGLFLAGVSLTAGIPRFVPRWVMWLGIVTAVACELASFTLVNFTAGYFIPVGRFISIIWMIAVSLTLPIGKPAPRPTPS